MNMQADLAAELQTWFLDSPIHLGGGKYAQYYTAKEAGPVYPEITAYAITIGALLFDRTGDERFLVRGREAAEYMIGIGSPAVPGIDGSTQYTFDTGIMVDGLLTLAQNDPEHRDRWLDYADIGLRWLAEAFQNQQYPSVVTDGKPDFSNEDPYAWHLDQSIHLVKLAIPFVKGSLELGNADYRTLGTELLDWGISMQLPAGRLQINERTERTRFHPHCYAMEGFAYSGAALKSQKYTDIAVKGSQWLADVQSDDGSFPQWFPETHAPLPKQVFDKVTNLRVGDAPSQAIRLWRTLDIAQPAAARAQAFIEDFRDGDGVPLRTHTLVGREIGPRKVFSWTTFFYLHACMIEHGETHRALELF